MTVAADKTGKVAPIEIPSTNMMGNHRVQGVGVSPMSNDSAMTTTANMAGPPISNFLKPMRETYRPMANDVVATITGARTENHPARRTL